MIKKIIHKIRNKELKKYLLWKFSLRSIVVYLKRLRFTLLNPKTLMDKSSFQLVNSKHGKIVINLNDESSRYIGVSSQIMLNGVYEQDEVNTLKKILILCKHEFGERVVFLDCGSNLGVFTLEASKLMKNWGEIYSFEPQLPIYNAMVQTLNINNCSNVKTFNIAIGSKNDLIKVPYLDYSSNENFGGLELDESNLTTNFNIQKNQKKEVYEVELKKLDSFEFERVDLVKIDVEGMEINVLEGSNQIIENKKPIFFFEHLKSDRTNLFNFFHERNYKIKEVGPNALAVSNNSNISLDIF